MSVKTLVVFPLLPPEVQEIIASECDTYSLLALSSVNKSAFDYLPNVDFFQEHYFKQHPLLKPYDKLYTVLITTHPSNCWKVMCKVMDAQWGPIEKPFAKRVSFAFMQEAQPRNVDRINAQIKAWEDNNKEICGSYFQDPSSPIDKAWKELERCSKAGEAAEKEWSELSTQMRDEVEMTMKDKNLQLDDDELTSIVNQFDDGAEAFVSCTYEEFQENSPDEIAGMNRDLFALYQKVVRDSLVINPLFENLRYLQTQCHALHHRYSHLENARKNNVELIEAHMQKLKKFQSNPAKIHLEDLKGERYEALVLERNLKDDKALRKCIDLVDNLIKHPEEQIPEAFEQVQCLINACNDYYRKRIWESLYHRCANRVIEDSWAEKHFKDHLPILRSILANVAKDTQAYLTTVAPKYMSNPPERVLSESGNNIPIRSLRVVLMHID